MYQQGFPTGNAFIIQTPKSDRLEQQIVQDQKQKDLNEARQAQLLDQEFSKNAAAIRDVDVKDAVGLYGKYKAIGQDLYKNGNRMTPEQRIAKQLEKQRAASAYYTLAAKSKELKDVEDLGQKNYFKDPNKMEETTPDYLLKSRNTPVLLHPGVADIMKNTELQTKDFSKIVSGAMGGNNGNPIKVATETKDNGNLTSTPTDYLALNSPSQFAQKVIEGVPTNRDRNKFVSQHSYDDLAAQDLITKYNELRQTPAFKKAYPNEPEINPDALNDPFKKAVTLLSLDHILRHPPVAMEGRPFNNTKDVIDYNNENKKAAATLAFERALRKANTIQDRKDARLKLMMDYNIDDIHGMVADSDKTKVLKFPGGGSETLVDITDMTDAQKEDLLGKPSSEQQRRQQKYKHEPIPLEGRVYVKKNEDGTIVAKDNEIIDPDQVLVNTFTRTGKLKKPLGKGELKIKDIKEKVVEEKPITTLNASEYKKKRKG